MSSQQQGTGHFQHLYTGDSYHGGTVIGFNVGWTPEQWATHNALQRSINFSNELRNELQALARRAATMNQRQLRAYIRSRPIFR